MKHLFKIFFLFSIVLINSINVYAQDPAYYKIGEEEFANIQVYTLLYDDSSDVIYAGTNNGLFAYKQNKFVKIKSAKEQKGTAVFSLIQNSKKDIFCINLSGQLFQLKNDALHLIYQKDKKDTSNYFWCNNIEDNTILVTSRDYIKKIKPNGTVEIIFDAKEKNYTIQSCNATETGVYIFCTDLYDRKRVLKYTNGKIETFFLNKTDSQRYLLSFISLNKKTFGLYRNGSLTNINHNLIQQFKAKGKEGPFLINSNLSIALAIDKGARYYYLDNNKVKTSPTIFKNTFLSAFTKSKKETLFFGTFGEGIIVVPNYKVKKTHKQEYLFLDITTTPTNNVALSTRSGDILSFERDSLVRIDKVPNNVDNIFYFPEFQFNSNKKFVYNNITKENIGLKDVVALNNNEILYASAQGVFLFNKITNISKRITAKRCNTIAWSKKDSMLFFTSNQGVYKKRISSSKTKELVFNKKSFLANDLTFIDNQLICGTVHNGVLIFKDEKLKFQLNQKDGLLSNSVKQVAIKDNVMYVLTHKGMQVYDMLLQKFLGLGVNEGVVATNITKFALSKDKLWLLEKHSFSSVAIKTIIKNEEHQAIRKLYIDSLLVDDKKINHLKNNTFKYTDNKLVVYFDYRDITTKQETKIKYTLEGYHTNWETVTTTKNSLEFNHLPRGKYTFKIKASYRNQETDTFTYAFKIKAPFWLTWWFYGLIAMLIITLIWYRFRQLKKENTVLFEKQKLKADLLDTELKALRSQMNPHFIFNALNSIQGLILEQKTDASYDYIVLFANLVRNTLNYSNKDFIPISDELAFLKVYLKLEKLRFGDDFSYTIDYKGDKEIQVPSLIVQPFIENALLHGLLHKSGDKKLHISFEFHKFLKCTIIDNGIGRDKAKNIQKRQGKRQPSFALMAIEKRLEILSQKNNIKFFFTITDLYENEKPIGTKVEITLPFKEVF